MYDSMHKKTARKTRPCSPIVPQMRLTEQSCKRIGQFTAQVALIQYNRLHNKGALVPPTLAGVAGRKGGSQCLLSLPSLVEFLPNAYLFRTRIAIMTFRASW